MGYLYSKREDLYYDPSKFAVIRFSKEVDRQVAYLQIEPRPQWIPGYSFFWLTDPDDVMALRRWCEQHSESW